MWNKSQQRNITGQVFLQAIRRYKAMPYMHAVAEKVTLIPTLAHALPAYIVIFDGGSVLNHPRLSPTIPANSC